MVSSLRMMGFCMACVDKMAREEEEKCDRIYKEYINSVESGANDNTNVFENKICTINIDKRKDNATDLPKMRIRKELRLMEKLFLHSGQITAEKIPFSGVNNADIVKILLEEVKGREASDIKAKIREEIRRWHPDKFLQKLGYRIEESEKESVMLRVKEVAQALNDYGIKTQ